jgi:Sel1 repeat
MSWPPNHFQDEETSENSSVFSTPPGCFLELQKRDPSEPRLNLFTSAPRNPGEDFLVRGEAHWFGLGDLREPNRAKAKEFYQRGAECGNVVAMGRCAFLGVHWKGGDRHCNAYGVENAKMAFILYCRALLEGECGVDPDSVADFLDSSVSLVPSGSSDARGDAVPLWELPVVREPTVTTSIARFRVAACLHFGDGVPKQDSKASVQAYVIPAMRHHCVAGTFF